MSTQLGTNDDELLSRIRSVRARYAQAKFAPTPEEEAGRRLNNAWERGDSNPAVDFARKEAEGATLGASPYLRGVGSAISGGSYAQALDAEKQRMADLGTFAPGASAAASTVGMLVSAALVPVPGMSAIAGAAEQAVTKGVASSAARGVAGRIAGHVASNAAFGGVATGVQRAFEAPGTVPEKLVAGAKAVPGGAAVGGVFGGALGGAGEAYGAANGAIAAGRAGRAAAADAAQVAREAPVWRNMPIGEETTPAQRAYLAAGDARAAAPSDALVERYRARTAPPVEIPPPERPPVVAPTDPMSARFRGLRRADEITAPPSGPSSLLNARGEPMAPERPAPIETAEERVNRLTKEPGPAATPQIILPPNRTLRQRAPAVADAAQGARQTMDAATLARDAGETAAPPPRFSVTPVDYPPPPRATPPAGRVGTEPPIGEGATRFARGEIGQERVPFNEIAPPARAPRPKAKPLPRQPEPPTVSAPGAASTEVVAPQAPAENLDELAKFAHTAQNPGEGDPVDVQLAAARIKKLSPADRATVLQKIDALAASRDPLTGLQREQPAAAPAAAGPLSTLPSRVRDHVQAALEAKTEAEVVTAASNLQGVRMTPEQGALVSKLIEEKRASLPKASGRLVDARGRPTAATAESAPAIAEPAPTASAAEPARSTPAELAKRTLDASVLDAERRGQPLSVEQKIEVVMRALQAEEASAPATGTPEVAPESTFPEAAKAEAPKVEAAPAAPPPEPRKPLEGPVGHTTSIRFPDGGRSPARWRVVESESLLPSHDPTSWSPREGYPEGVQQRQYKLDKTFQTQFEGRLTKYDPRAALDPTEDVGGGASTVDPTGIVLAGNERDMLHERLLQARPELHAEKRRLLDEQAPSIGIDPADYAHMKDPVKVRELTEPPTDVAGMRDLNRRSDIPVVKEKNPVSDASTRAARMRDATASLAHLTSPDTGMPPDKTLRAYLATSEGKGFVDALVKDRVIEPSELAKFRDPQTGALNEQGMDTVERTLEAAAIGNPETASLARANIPGTLNKLEHATPALVRASHAEGWDLGPKIEEALRLHLQAKDVPGGKLEDLLAQGSLLGEERNPDAVKIARFLDRSSKNDIKLAANRYADQASLAGRMGQSDDLFNAKPPTPEQAFKETFGQEPPKPAAKAAAPVKPRRDAGFAVTAALRPIVGATGGGLYGSTKGDTPDEQIKNAAIYAMLGAGIMMAPELKNAAVESKLGTAIARTARWIGSKGADYVESVGGTAGRYLADDIRQIDMRSTFRYGAQHVDAAAALEGLTPEETILAKKVADSRPSATNAPKKVQKAGEALRAVLDKDKDAAASVGIGISEKTGHAYPQIPTQEAVEALDELKTVGGLQSVKVQKLAAAMVKDRIAGHMQEALDKLEAYQAVRDGRVAFRTPKVGMNPYLESSRFQLPEDYVDWGNNAAFKSAMRRNATTIEAARQWGPKHEATSVLLNEIARHAGSDVATDIEGYLSHDFGGISRSDRARTTIVSAISNYETATKLGNFLSPLLNYGQQFANLAHLPLEAQYKAFKAYPPIIGRFMKEGAALREWAERSGVVYGHTAMADAPTGASGKITDALLSGFIKAAKSNEVRTAIASRYALEADLERVMKAMPEKTSGLSKFLDVISGRDVSQGADGALEGAPVRRLEKLGIGRDKLAEIMASGRRLTPGEHLEAAYRLVHDTQFPMTVASKPIWWSRNPVARLAAKFKPFGMRQTQYIYENVLKEAARGNMAPVAKFVAAATITGEMYNIARDVVLGSDKSVSVHALKNEGDVSHIGKRMLNDFAAQGGLGLIWDLQYGLSNWLGGPVISTFNNLTDALGASSDAISKDRWGQLPATALEFAKAEAPGLRQGTTVYDRAKAAAMGDSPLGPYMDLKADALRHSGAAEDPGDYMGQAVGQMLRGQESFQTSINTIPYRAAADAIRTGDPVKAADHLAVVLRGTDDLTQAIGSARATLSRRGPLGGLSDQQRRDYLASLDSTKRDDAVRLNMRWRTDSEKAIRTAVVKARQP